MLRFIHRQLLCLLILLATCGEKKKLEAAHPHLCRQYLVQSRELPRLRVLRSSWQNRLCFKRNGTAKTLSTCPQRGQEMSSIEYTWKESDSKKTITDKVLGGGSPSSAASRQTLRRTFPFKLGREAAVILQSKGSRTTTGTQIRTTKRDNSNVI